MQIMQLVYSNPPCGAQEICVTISLTSFLFYRTPDQNISPRNESIFITLQLRVELQAGAGRVFTTSSAPTFFARSSSAACRPTAVIVNVGGGGVGCPGTPPRCVAFRHRENTSNTFSDPELTIWCPRKEALCPTGPKDSQPEMGTTGLTEPPRPPRRPTQPPLLPVAVQRHQQQHPQPPRPHHRHRFPGRDQGRPRGHGLEVGTKRQHPPNHRPRCGSRIPPPPGNVTSQVSENRGRWQVTMMT